MNGQPGSFPLSERGEARRAEILGAAQESLRRRVRRRTAMRGAGVVGALALATVAALTMSRGPAPRPGPKSVAATTRFIETDPGVVGRVRIMTRPVPAHVRISDDEFQELMAEAGRDSGIVRVDGRFLRPKDLNAESPATEPSEGGGG